MSNTLSTNQLKAAIGWDYEVPLAYGNNVQSASFSYSKTLATGTGSGNANKLALVWCDSAQTGQGAGGVTTSLAASSANTYDLTNIVDPFGTSLSFTKIRAVYIENTSTNASSTITIEPSASNGWQGTSQLFDAAGTTPQAKLRVKPGGVTICICTDANGWTVDSTHKSFAINNEDSVNAATYRMVFIGE